MFLISAAFHVLKRALRTNSCFIAWCFWERGVLRGSEKLSKQPKVTQGTQDLNPSLIPKPLACLFFFSSPLTSYGRLPSLHNSPSSEWVVDVLNLMEDSCLFLYVLEMPPAQLCTSLFQATCTHALCVRLLELPHQSTTNQMI